MAKPKTIRWLEALSAYDIQRLHAFISSPLFPCRKETIEFVAAWSPEIQWADWDRAALGKIQSDLKKFLAILAFTEGLQSSTQANLYAMRAMRSRIKKPGEYATVGFDWSDYDQEMNAFRTKAEKDGLYLELFQAESDYLSFKLQNGKKVNHYPELAQLRDKSLDLWYLSTRLRNMCVAFINHDKQKAEKNMIEGLIKDGTTILTATKLASLKKNPLLRFYADFWEYLTYYFKSKVHSHELMKPLMNMLRHEKILADPIANALVYSLILISVNRGDPELTLAFYQMLKTGLTTGHFRDLAGKIPVSYYRAITLAAIMANKTAEIEKLLPIWKDEIGSTPAKRDALFQHCKAQLLLSKGKYAQAWETCKDTQFKTSSQRWYHAELRFRIQYEAEAMGIPLRESIEGAWIDTREEELAEMRKIDRTNAAAPTQQQSQQIWATKTKAYILLENTALSTKERKAKIRVLFANQEMAMHDWAWFAKVLKTEAGSLRPHG